MELVYEAEAVPGYHAAAWRAINRARLDMSARQRLALAALALAGLTLTACTSAPGTGEVPGTSQLSAAASIEGIVLTPAMLFPEGPAELLLRTREKRRLTEWPSERRSTGPRDGLGRWTLRFETRSGAQAPWTEVRRLELEMTPAGGVAMRTLRDAARKTQLTFTPSIEIFPAQLGPGSTTRSQAAVESFDLDAQGQPKGRPDTGTASHTTEHAGSVDGVESVVSTLRLELSGAVVTRTRRAGFRDASLEREREELVVKVGPFTVDRSVRELER
jgi:predicted small secreted protein